jgi:hypothetical protein
MSWAQTLTCGLDPKQSFPLVLVSSTVSLFMDGVSFVSGPADIGYWASAFSIPFEINRERLTHSNISLVLMAFIIL